MLENDITITFHSRATGYCKISTEKVLFCRNSIKVKRLLTFGINTF